MAKEKASRNHRRTSAIRAVDPVPAEILRQYPEQYLIYSDDEGRVIGAGSTEDEAWAQAEASGVKHPWHFAYSEWSLDDRDSE
jgi:hypothetical protein